MNHKLMTGFICDITNIHSIFLSKIKIIFDNI